MINVKQETVNGAKWLILQKLTLQPLQFLYSMVLARLITPEEMGLLGLTAIFFAIANTLASAGFGSALIRKIDRTNLDCDTAFWFNVSMSLLMSAILYLAAPYFVQFYNQPELLWLTRCSAILMFLSSTGGIHWTLYTARRDFKTPAIIQTIGTIISMPVCLIAAYQGWGVWALMAGSMTSAILSLIWVWIVSPWKPRAQFSTTSFRLLFGFGSKLALGGLITTIFSNLRPFIVGKFYSPHALGMYAKGDHMGRLFPQMVTGIFGSVTYPILATLQDDKQRLTSVYRKYIKTASLPIAFGCTLIAALAEPFVELCLGNQWLPCTIFVQIISLAVMFDHVSSINLSLLSVLGRSDILLGLEIVKKSILLVMILYAATISVTAMCAVSLFYAQIAIFLNSYFTGKYLRLTWWMQLKDYWFYIIMSAFAATPAFLLTLTHLPGPVTLIIGSISATLLYLTLLVWKKDDTLVEFISLLEQQAPFLRNILAYVKQRITARATISTQKKDNSS